VLGVCLGGERDGGRVLGYGRVDEEDGGGGEGRGEGTRRIEYQKFTDEVEDGVGGVESDVNGAQRENGETRDGRSHEEP